MSGKSMGGGSSAQGLWVLWMALVGLGVSEGVCQDPSPATTVVAEGDIWRYLKGVSEPPAAWREPELDDSQWLEGPTPIGYGSDLTYATRLEDMRADPAAEPPNPGYISVFLRKTFVLESYQDVGPLFFRVRYDDGFVAYLNGEEILRGELPGEPGTPVPFDAAASSHEDWGVFNLFVLPCEARGLLREGANVLAVQGHNAEIASPDFSFSAELVVLEETAICPPHFSGSPAVRVGRSCLK